MTEDPFTVRRHGLRRVRVVTAWAAAGTVVGTGATGLALASADQASAQQTSTPGQQGTDDGSESGTLPGSDDGSQVRVVVPSTPGDGVQPPVAPPRRTSGGPRHASSGSS